MSELREQIDELRQRLEKLPHALEYSREGCTDEDIRALEAYAEHAFPQAYVEFLKVFGRRNGRFFSGMSACLTDRYGLRMKELANDVLERKCGIHRIPEPSFVYLELQGYAFWYFPLGAADNPPVFTIGEGESEPWLVSPTFTESLAMYIEELDDLLARHPAAFRPPWKPGSMI